MAYQPLYATIRDENGVRGTHSLRSRVEWVSFWLNSHFGEVMTVHADSKGELDKKDTYEAEQKIKDFQTQGNIKKVEVWSQKLKERQAYNSEQEKQESVRIEINLEANPKFEFVLNGIIFSYPDLKLLEQYKERDFLGKLSIASAFGLIPDICRLVDNPTEENKNAFIEKRDKITKFLKEEEDKLKV